MRCSTKNIVAIVANEQRFYNKQKVPNKVETFDTVYVTSAKHAMHNKKENIS